MIDISVIIPCYNRSSTICSSIQSVFDQTFSGNVEVIVSDDGSSDGSIEIIKNRYGARIILVEKPFGCRSQGAAGARNRGLLVAQGRYIAFLDSDDYYLPDFLQKMFDALEKDKNLGYSFCRVNKMIKEKDIERTTNWTRKKLSQMDVKYHILNSPYVICTIGQMIRKEIIEQVGLFDETLKVGEDSDMWIRISEKSNGVFLDFVGAVYCIDGYCDNQLTKLSHPHKKFDGRQVYLNALQRNLSSGLLDKTRLFLIVKNLMFDSLLSSKLNFIKVRLMYGYFRLFMAMPFQTVKYLINNIRI